GSDGYTHVLDTEMLNEVATLYSDDAVNAVSWHPKKPVLVTGGKDAHLRFWNTETWKEIRAIPAHNFAIYDIEFNRSGTRCITTSFDKTIKIWDTETFDVLHRIDHKEGGHRSSVNCALFDERGQLWTASDDHKIKIWNIE
ncbi:MAG: hypothetical protein HKN32_07090, partial [Flavobacteriales bacterium]|nr:hypothetical protein [Flavobacteriales bacterium]